MTTSRTEADTARYNARIDAAYARAGQVRTAPAVKLTPAAKRDLALMRSGVRVDFRYGPLTQLLDAGLIESDGRGYYRVVSA